MKVKILHLSDIHISSKEGEEYKRLRTKLLDDLSNIGNEIDAVVITGDIIDRNDIGAWNLAKDFIDKLLPLLNLSVQKLFIVPGNHDMERNNIVKAMLEPCIKGDLQVKETDWSYIVMRLSHYSKFLEDFSFSEEKEGFGVRYIEKNGKKICFNMINSAWASIGNEDYGKLLVGKNKLDKNVEVLRELTNKEIVITIMHHPIDWLEKDEGELLEDYLLSDDKFNSPILLHGHIHQTQMSGKEIPNGKYLSLVSGIGYPEGNARNRGQLKISECKYSVYTIDTEYKEIDCYCRKSIESGNFVPDNTLYNGSENGHYLMTYGIGKTIGTNVTDMKEEVGQYELDPIPIVNCWTGRKEELELLAKKDYNVFFISGVGGQGKTALASEFLCREAEKFGFVKRIWIDCRELEDTVHVKLLQLLEIISDGKECATLYQDEQLKDTVKRFIKHITRKRYLIVFDNVDAYINFESDELIGELKSVVENVLDNANRSVLIFTCRAPIYNAGANFRNIKLDGLTEPEGIQFFEKRGVKIRTDEDKAACKNLIKITKGHPWWLGLIAGQMIADNLSPEKYMEENGEDMRTHSSKLNYFFQKIWNKLSETGKGKESQAIIFYLAESSRPLSIEDLSILLDINYNQTSRLIRKLSNMSLLIEHDDKTYGEKVYHIHPLVRQFVHEQYSSDYLREYVARLLQIIMIGQRAYEYLFGQDNVDEVTLPNDTRDIIDSIETCLNSRNESEALRLISYYRNSLCDNKCHADFLSLSNRIMKSIDWNKEQVAIVRSKARFLSEYLDLLSMQDGTFEQVMYLLKKYENCCEKGTIYYTGYLSIKAYVLWRIGHIEEAYGALVAFENLKNKGTEVWEACDMINLKGTILRERGCVDEAIKIFENNSPSAARDGNLAKCYFLIGEYEKSLKTLAKCLQSLIKHGDLSDEINKGYAFLWIAEVYNEMKLEKRAKAFLLISQEIWKEYAPGLLPKTEMLMRHLQNVDMEFSKKQREQMIDEFIASQSIMDE